MFRLVVYTDQTVKLSHHTFLLVFSEAGVLSKWSSFKPLSDNVLIEQLEAKTQTASGLILPSSDVDVLFEATTSNCCCCEWKRQPNKALSQDGSRSTMSVSEGDVVVFANCQTTLSVIQNSKS